MYTIAENPCDPNELVLPNGMVSVTNNFTDESLNASCRVGYTLVYNLSISQTQDKLLCDLNGKWLNKPTCMRK